MRPGASQYHELSKVRAQSLAHGVSRARKQCTRAAMRSYSLGCPTSILGKAKVFVLSELLTPARPARAPARPAMHARPMPPATIPPRRRDSNDPADIYEFTWREHRPSHPTRLSHALGRVIFSRATHPRTRPRTHPCILMRLTGFLCACADGSALLGTPQGGVVSEGGPVAYEMPGQRLGWCAAAAPARRSSALRLV